MRYVWGILFLFASAAVAQQAVIWGTVYTSSAPTLANRQSTVWRGNVNGKLVTDISAGSCSNSLDFSDACNSQYLPLLGAL